MCKIMNWERTYRGLPYSSVCVCVCVWILRVAWQLIRRLDSSTLPIIAQMMYCWYQSDCSVHTLQTYFDKRNAIRFVSKTITWLTPNAEEDQFTLIWWEKWQHVVYVIKNSHNPNIWICVRANKIKNYLGW